jgi:transcriptional regulator with XRE-family HTH domain
MDDLRFGQIVRGVRRRRGLRQVDLARQAGFSQQTVSDLERGRFDSLRVIRKIAGILEIRVPLAPEWRGGDVDRLLDRRHAALVEAATAALQSAGWETTAEFTFNRYGDRGAVDILGWQSARRAVLIVEVKTSLNNLQELLAKLDRKTRVVPGIVAAEWGWRALSVGTVLLVAEESGMRRPIARHAATFSSTLPARNIEVRRWIADPAGQLRGIWFLAATGPRGTRRVSRTAEIVSSASGRVERRVPRSSGAQTSRHETSATHKAP